MTEHDEVTVMKPIDLDQAEHERLMEWRKGRLSQRIVASMPGEAPWIILALLIVGIVIVLSISISMQRYNERYADENKIGIACVQSGGQWKSNLRGVMECVR